MPLEAVDSGEDLLPLYRVDNGTITLTFLPGVGGRLISLTRGGHELLWRNPAYLDGQLRFVRSRDEWPRYDGTFASWVNIGGSKTWPAPQGWDGPGQWAGPPDPVLDSGQWSIVEEAAGADGETRVSLTSPDDLRSGLRVTRSFTVPVSGTSFQQKTSFLNISSSPIWWAIWEVCQVDTADGAAEATATIEVDVDGDDYRELGQYYGELEWGASIDGRLSIAIQDVVAKVGFPQASGRIAYHGPTGHRLELTFVPVPDADYPDEGSRAELWMQSPLEHPIAELSGLHPDAYLAELEVLSPRFAIAPGATVEYSLGWSVASSAGMLSRTQPF